MHVLQNPDSDTKKITSHQKKRVKISPQSDSQRHTNYATTIDELPDDVLLEIFDLIRVSRTYFEFRHKPVWKWHILVHVCRRWREIVFASPLRLDLQLLCTNGTPVREDLGRWPSFPLVVDYDFRGSFTPVPNFEDDVIAALEHPCRIRHIRLTVTSSLWRKMAPVMQEPFPALTSLSISSTGMNLPTLPGEFLGGSAPCLREIQLRGIPTPALSNLLSSTSDLVELVLFDIPRADYILPTALVACLAMLPRLNNLSIRFEPWYIDDLPIQLPPHTRAVLPALTSISFEGGSAYLEDFLAQIDAPILNSIDITYQEFFNPRIPQLSEFINRSDLKPSRFRDARIYIDDSETIFVLLGPGFDLDEFPVSIHMSSCEGIFDQAQCMAQVLSQTSAMLSNVVRLGIVVEPPWQLYDEDEDMDDIEWLELLCPFTAVEIMDVSGECAESVADALEEIPVERVNEVLPALKLLCLEGDPVRSIEISITILRGRVPPLTITRYEGLIPEGSEPENVPLHNNSQY